MGKIKEKQSVTMSGILNVQDMIIEVEDEGERDIKELLRNFDGKDVSISVNMTKEL